MISILIYLLVAVVLLRPLGLLSLMIADGVKHVVHTIHHARDHAPPDWPYVRLRHFAYDGKITWLPRSWWESRAYLTAEFMAGLVDVGTTVGRLLVVLVERGMRGCWSIRDLVFLLDLRDAKSLRSILPERKTK